MRNNLLKSLVIGTATAAGLAGRLDAESTNSASKVLDGTEYYFQTDKFSYSLGETVNFDYRITNLNFEPENYRFADSQSFEVIVKKEGLEVYRWSYDWLFMASGMEFTLNPGESREFNDNYYYHWDQSDWNGTQQTWDDIPATPGSYTLTAEALCSDWNQNRVSLNIEITPEPATFTLLGVGWAAEELTRRLRRKKKGAENSFVGPGNPYGL